MVHEMRSLFVGLVVISTLLLLVIVPHGCTPAPLVGCLADKDCKGDRVCVDKSCVDPSASKEGGGETSAEATTEPSSPQPDEAATPPVDAAAEPPTPERRPEPPTPDTAAEPTTPDMGVEPLAPDVVAETPPQESQTTDTSTCQEGTTRTCYTGPTGSEGVGECKAGKQTCAAGMWGACTGDVTPKSEVCGDTLDNNCDGTADENCGNCSKDGETQPCYSGPAGTQNKGPCRAGVRTCQGGNWSSCVGEIIPSTEICDGIDNNCDGSIDENINRPCYAGPTGTAGIGACKGGTQTCVSGLWGSCTGEVVPKTEICNNIDDDCDGTIDNGLSSGAACTVAGAKGICAPGKQSCTNGTLVCTPNSQAGTEICNGLDDDCDGQVDENLPCAPTCFEVSQKSIDFGALPTGCNSARKTVSVTNKCTSPVSIQAAGLTGTTGPEFILYTTLTTPFSLAVGATQAFELGFKPSQIASSTGGLRIVLSNGGTYAQIDLKGEGVSSTGTTEKFIVPKASKVDVLFIMDDSCSMSTHQSNMAAAFPAFYTRATQYQADYQIGVITTDVPSKKGYLQGTPKIITPLTPNASAAFARNITVGTSGSANEQGLETSRLALSAPAISNQNVGFLRADAVLSLVYVSDEPDYSTSTVASYISFFQSLKTSKDLLRASLLGPFPVNDARCNQAGACRYYEVMKALGGLHEELRTSTVSTMRTFLEKLADFTLGQQSFFALAGTPDATSITVKVNGTLATQSTTNGWQYEASSRAIRFTGTAIPASGASVEVSYKPNCIP